jgi:hypothetical protein
MTQKPTQLHYQHLPQEPIPTWLSSSSNPTQLQKVRISSINYEDDLGWPLRKVRYHQQTEDGKYQSLSLQRKLEHKSLLTTAEIIIPNTSITMRNSKGDK